MSYPKSLSFLLIFLLIAYLCLASTTAGEEDTRLSRVIEEIKKNYPADTYFFGIGRADISDDSEKDNHKAEMLAKTEIAKTIRVHITEEMIDELCERTGRAYKDSEGCRNQVTVIATESVNEFLIGTQIVRHEREDGQAWAVAVIPRKNVISALKDRIDDKTMPLPKVKVKKPPIIVEAEGKSPPSIDYTPAQAKNIALKNARLSALNRSVGVEVKQKGSLLRTNRGDEVNELIATATKGIIVNEEILDAKILTNNENQISAHVKIKAAVEPLDSQREGGLDIITMKIGRPDVKWVSQPVFQERDEVQIIVKVNKPSFIHIFGVSQDDRVTKLYPHPCCPLKKVEANEEFMFPDNGQRGKGIKVRAVLEKGVSQSIESVVAIATKDKHQFLSGSKNNEAMITDLMREFSEIRMDWAFNTTIYEVRR